jgi:multiple PDZ domain protein
LCVAEKIVEKYGDLGGQLHMVEFQRIKGHHGLGMSLAGNRDLSTMSVFVVGIIPDSPSARDGRLRVGDQLLEVSITYPSNLSGVTFYRFKFAQRTTIFE